MIDIVTEEKTTFGRTSGAAGSRNTELQWSHHLGRAVDYLMDIGIERMASYEEELIKKAEEVLDAIPQVTYWGIQNSRQAVFPFRSMACILTILQV